MCVIVMTNRIGLGAYINVNNRLFVTGFRLIIERVQTGCDRRMLTFRRSDSSFKQTLLAGRGGVVQSKQTPCVKVSCCRDKYKALCMDVSLYEAYYYQNLCR